MSGPTDPLFWKRARDAFDEVASLPPPERDSRLAALCASDAALRAEVESLLAHADAPRDVISAILEHAAQRVIETSPLHVGQRLLHYTVTGEIGQGGMGVVWKATDRTLGRDVAIKVLPSAVAKDPALLARLDREAKLLASLNHTNVAAIYSLHEAAGTRFLAMEFVEGEDLAARIARGAVPVRDLLSIARQLADALEEAHEKGVIHRDLKPANIKITPAGKVKVLDFGLAKAMGQDVAIDQIDRIEEPESRAAVSALATRTGVIFGTAPYMAPEQARGLAVDRRVDIWSFGVLLFEMLSGRRPFNGATLNDVLDAVVATEPDWNQLPQATPVRLERLIRRCLEKEPRQRLRDIGEARIELEQVISGADDPAHDRRAVTRSRRRDAAMAILGAAAAAVLAVWLLWPARDVDPGLQRFNVALPTGVRIEDALDAGRQTMALSRDGRQLAFVTRDAARRKQIHVRRMDRVDAEPIPGTEGADMPFFSPDGSQLGFASEGKLRRVSLSGGAPAVICDAPEARGASWGDDGTIVFAPGAFTGLARVPAAGGAPVAVTTLKPATEESHRWPILVPGGRAVIFGTVPAGRRDEQDAAIDLVRLDTGARRTLVRGGVYPRYVDGHLLYASEGRIVAAPFDLSRLETTGPAVPVLNDVRMDLLPDRRVLMDVSLSGALAYVPEAVGVAERALVWLDRHGVSTAVVSETRAYRGAQLSPDGRSLAVLIEGSPITSLWNYSLERRTWNRLTFDQDVSTPAWMPDSSRIIYSSDGLRTTYSVAADGGGRPVRLMPEAKTAGDMPAIAPNGRIVLIAVQNSESDDIISLTLDDKQTVAPFQAEAGNEASPAFSPDGKYVAYSSTASGRREVYIRTFARPVRKWPVSVDGGITPRWSRDGRELFFLAGPRMMAVSVTPTVSGLTIGTPTMLFEEPALTWNGADAHRYDVSADGQRFIITKPDPREVRPLQLVVVPQFVRELRARLAAQR